VVFVPPLTNGKLRNEGVTIEHCSMPVRQFVCNLQTRRAFIAAFTSEKRWMTIKKVYSAIGIDNEFFHCALFNPCMM
jgi:hypothetical protein